MRQFNAVANDIRAGKLSFIYQPDTGIPGTDAVIATTPAAVVPRTARRG